MTTKHIEIEECAYTDHGGAYFVRHYAPDGTPMADENCPHYCDREAAEESVHQERIDRRNADRIDGYDRDDLGESGDY